MREAIRRIAREPLAGKPLKGPWARAKVRSYRVWPFRVLYRLVGSGEIEVLAVGHRRDVYR